MKVAITGHTHGIGKAIADRLGEASHEVLGFSRSTGHDLIRPGMIQKIANEAIDCDVFVNNAHTPVSGFAQTELIYAIRDKWAKLPDKTIFAISSTIADVSLPEREPYAVHKFALNKACDQLQRSSACRIVVISPGLTDTRRATGSTRPKLSPENVADAFMWALTQPSSILIKNITLAARADDGFIHRPNSE